MLHKVATALYTMVVLGLVLLLIAFYVQAWLLEIIISQAPLLTVAAAVALVGLLILRIRLPQAKPSVWLFNPDTVWPWLLAVALLATNTLHIYTVFSPSQTVAQGNSNTLHYATYNKLYTNNDLDSAGAVFAQQGVDIISMQEVVVADIEYYQQILGFDYSAISTSGHSAFGSEVGIVSKYPLLSAETVSLGGGMGVLRSVVDLPGTDVVIYTAHILPPITPQVNAQSQQALDTLASVIVKEELPVLVGGDFNSTVFSPKLRSFIQQINPRTSLAALNNSPVCSWHGAVAGWPLCMRIDHVFYDEGIDLLGVRVSGDVGSDHRIVTATLAF